jgi:hypothetical protein
VCPTNLDPAFDRPPEAGYICEVCHVQGAHFKSLCPQNRDPSSIIMKRKARGIKAQLAETCSSIKVNLQDHDSPSTNQRGNLVDRIITDHGRLSEASQNSNSATQQKSAPGCKGMKLEQELQGNKEKRKLGFEQDEFCLEDFFSNANQGNDRYKDKRDRKFNPENSELRKKLRIDDPSSKIYEEVDITDLIFDSILKQADNIKAANSNPGRSEGQGISAHSKQSVHQPGPNIWPQKVNLDENSISSNEIESSDEMDTESSPIKPSKVYSEVVLKLIQRLPQMTEEVNRIKGRITTLDKWKTGSERQVGLEIL